MWRRCPSFPQKTGWTHQRKSRVKKPKKITYIMIKEYVEDKYGLMVSSLQIAQTKIKCGIIERDNYNKSKNDCDTGNFEVYWNIC